ncbi:N-acetylglucosamine-6-phosphate deacetylase [Shewanella sp. WXL01]|uniref:N-acetylglucosamine-6-phosphate deacetylase n=1 Tax=Shewanella sp. WXL01 TaxID=2709721 RepID=UPI0014382D34|nr:N-acetylglucosamine-6-phosphate deacetylase [Shewanella sp. WXL01]NKF50167.1 N-acetylglucosamine-6-phosphate deacetylase [Shewanella sp. WXL01]
MKHIFKAKTLFDGTAYREDVLLATTAGVISAIEPANSEQGKLLLAEVGEAVTEVSGLLTPGFIDVQVNGGGGALFNAAPTVECIETIGQAHAQFGTTGFLPTVITDELEVMTQAADAVAQAIAQNVPGVLGIHFEGPHLSVPKKGVHPEQHVRQISQAEIELFCRDDLGVKVVTLAPENVSPEVIKQLVDAGVQVCIGHSNADYQTTQKAIAAGASGFTHLFNAMSAFTSREPGVVGAALNSPDTWCGVIVDGHHVHAATLQVAIKAKPQGKIMLVTDAMPPVGQDLDASFELFGTQVIRQGDRLNAPTGELAGCVLDMVGAVNNCVDMLQLELTEALRMAALYPSQFTGVEQGQIAIGKAANFVELTGEAGKMQVAATYISGNRVFAAQNLANTQGAVR